MSRPPAAAPRPGAKGERTRADIVRSAGRLFYEHGYERTSFSDIVAASGLVRGNIYHYFKTKDQILEAVIEARLEEFRTLLGRWEREHVGPEQRLQAFVAMIVGRQSDLIAYGCPIGSLNIELGKDRRELQKAARLLFDLFRDWLAECLRELGVSEDAEALALHLLGRAQGIAVMAQVYRDRALLRAETTRLHGWISDLPRRSPDIGTTPGTAPRRPRTPPSGA